MKRYQTDYSNQVHQLLITPSKHCFVTTKGLLKYQKKPFEIKLDDLENSKKAHTIHYLIRDHYSGLFYWEICRADDPIPIHEFLYRAWNKKETHPLFGIPEFMTIPKNAQTFFPGLMNFIEHLEIVYIKVTSGFQGGVRDVRTIEEELRCGGLFYGTPDYSPTDLSFDLVAQKTDEICSRFIDSSFAKPSKKDKWLSGLGAEQRVYVPESLEMFKTIYFEN